MASRRINPTRILIWLSVVFAIVLAVGFVWKQFFA